MDSRLSAMSALAGILDETVGSDGAGAIVAVARAGEIVDVVCRGLANIEHGVPMSRDTVNYLASTSKQFVACSIALLEADGKLGLDDDVREYVPELARLPEVVRIFHLVHHTSGIRDKYALGTIGSLPEDAYATDRGTMRLLAGQRSLNFAPGSRFMYSNSGYFLLAQVVGRVSGKPFQDFARERIFEPLGMKDTLFRHDPDVPLPNRASGHRRGAGGWRLAEYRMSSLGPGGAWSTVADLARWDKALADDELMETARLLRTRELTDGKTNPYAFGLTVGAYRGAPVVQHAGGVQGHTADFVRFPDQGVAVIAFCNGGAAASVISRRAADVFLGDELEPPLPAATGGGAPAEPDLARLAGTYVDPDDTIIVTIAPAPGSGGVQVHFAGTPLPVRVRSATVLESPNGITASASEAGLSLSGLGADAIELRRLAPPAASATSADGGRFVSAELGAALSLGFKDECVTLARDGEDSVPIEQLADGLYAWPADALGSPTVLPLRIERNAEGRALAVVVSMSRALNVRFDREPEPDAT
jgi:CubicO group peptidase (beta-lactamase class C family)